MTFTFLGCFYPQTRFEEIAANSRLGVDHASNNYQWAMLKGLDGYLDNYKIVTAPFIRNYPKGYKKILFRGSTFAHRKGSKDYCIGFINLVGLYSISRFINIFLILKKVLKKSERNTIFIYSVHLPFIAAVLLLSKIGYDIRTCLAVPDLPQTLLFVKKRGISKSLKAIDNMLIEIFRKKIDSYMLFSERMTEVLDLHNKPYVVIEGIYHYKPSIKLSKQVVPKTVLYTGKMNINSGIETLIEAIKILDGFELWIRGHGPLLHYVLSVAKNQQKIKYFPEMSRESLYQLQRNAAVLVNPMPKSAIDSKYFFPSKTMDYLASGTPVIMAKLDCIPNEYHEHLFFLSDESVKGMRDEILRVCSLPFKEVQQKTKRAKNFILEKKSPEMQIKKLLQLLSHL